MLLQEESAFCLLGPWSGKAASKKKPRWRGVIWALNVECASPSNKQRLNNSNDTIGSAKLKWKDKSLFSPKLFTTWSVSIPEWEFYVIESNALINSDWLCCPGMAKRPQCLVNPFSAKYGPKSTHDDENDDDVSPGQLSYRHCSSCFFNPSWRGSSCYVALRSCTVLNSIHLLIPYLGWPCKRHYKSVMYSSSVPKFNDRSNYL